MSSIGAHRIGPRRRRRAVLALALAVLVASLAAAPTAAPRDEPVRAAILGGSIDRQPDVGWVTAVMRHPSAAPGLSEYERQYCAGSLVNRGWVLTAAHCVYDEETGVADQPGTLQVLVGQKVLSEDPTVSQEETRDVTQVVVFRRYDPQRSRWDAALLRLESPVSEQPVELVDDDRPQDWAPGKRAWIPGWGDRRPADVPDTDFPTELYSAFIPIVSSQTCKRAWPSRFYRRAMFCAGNVSGRPDTCIGDSGGPIARRVRGEWLLIGITSFGRCGTRWNHGVYTRMASPSLQRWLREEIRKPLPSP
jgi:secreted trypsin-like serine protease